MRWPNHLQLVLIYLFIIAACSIALTYKAYAHIAGHPEWDEWMAAQVVPDRPDSQYSCCNKSDAYLLDDDAVRVVDGQYEALLEGKWVQFPNLGQGVFGNTVLATSGNPTGHAVAWWTPAHGPYCFAEGTMS